MVEGLDLARPLVAVAFIPGDELGADGDNGDVYVGAVVFARVVDGGGEQVFSDALGLPIRPDAEHAEV